MTSLLKELSGRSSLVFKETEITLHHIRDIVLGHGASGVLSIDALVTEHCRVKFEAESSVWAECALST